MENTTAIAAWYARARALWDSLNGASDNTGPPGWFVSVLWGVWWGCLLAMALCFGGQSSKFIYIDF